MKPAKSSADELSPARFLEGLLREQSRRWRRNEAGAIAGRGAEPLHQLRVAIRRFRAVLRFFKKPLAKTSAASLDRALGKLNRDLGQARDVDVWVDFLLGKDVRMQTAGEPQWDPFLRNQRQLKRRHDAKARRILCSGRYARLCRRADRFLEMELPRLGSGWPPDELKHFIAMRIRRAFQRSLKAVGRRLRLSPERMHKARVRIRRARYWAEFFEPVLGPVSHKLARRLKRVADELGWVRDLDVQLEKFCSARAGTPRRLLDQLKKMRRGHQRASKRALHRLRKPGFKQRVLKALSPRAGR